MRRGFKTEAKKLAVEVRLELGLTAHEVFDPYALAREYGVDVKPISTLGLEEIDLETARDGRTGLSGMVIADGHRLIIVENDFHAEVRRRSTVSHEMSHILLDHEHPALLTYDRRCGSAADQEEEATWLAGELLIPHDAAVRMAWKAASDAEVADSFDVSIQQARWRMNHSGARRIAERSSRKRAS